MYFLAALIAAAISGTLWLIFKDRKSLHLEILTIAYGAATLMWLVDCIASVAGGEGFLDFSDPNGGWIALWTILGGLFIWMLLSFILNNKQKQTA